MNFLESREKALRVAQIVSEKKGENIVIIDVSKALGITDFIIICTGATPLQRKAIQRTIEEEMEKLGFTPRGVEGREGTGWTLLDYYDFIVHIFSPRAREFYGLEELYQNLPKITEF
uniref:Ribosomal silencing factor RsfS n=1 Tax=Dictyoglomus thermophilum TaxID=14 RepID=A0A7C3MHS5_DICTH